MLNFRLLLSLYHFFVTCASSASSVKKGSIKFSALVSQIVGKVGGTVFSSVKSGAVIQNMSGSNLRPKRTGIKGVKNRAVSGFIYWYACLRISPPGFLNPDGSQQPSLKNLNTKQNMRKLSKSWAQLLDEDRAYWYWVATNGPSKNRVGVAYTPSAFSCYMRTNLVLMSIGLSPVARGYCNWISVIDSDAQETMLCYICEGEILYCFYPDPGADDGGTGSNARLQATFDAGGDNGYLAIFTSRPLTPGKTAKANKKLLCVIAKADNYKNFLLGPMLNLLYGKNIYGNNIQIEQVLVNAGGAVVSTQTSTIKLNIPDPGYKISYTERAEYFNWLGSGTEWDFGSIAPLAESVKTFLIYGITLAVLSSYTILITQGFETNFTIIYGDPAEPLNLDDLLTDEYGNIPPIPLQITFSPQTSGVKYAQVTITSGSETLTIDLTGTGT